MAAFPPQRATKATSISTSDARTWLSTYLINSETTPLLQPDALLTAAGPIQSQGMSSVIIHNLKRLQSGLNGKYDVNPLATSQTDKHFKGAVTNVDEIYAAGDDWQDKSEFEREQSVEMGDIDERDPGHGTTVNATKSKAKSDGIDKNARKNAKKERRKQLMIERQKKNQD